MKLMPVVKVIEIDGIPRRGGIIRQVAIAKDVFARFVVVNITAHRRVVLLDGILVERLGVLFHPSFKLRVSRFLLPDVILNRRFVEAERGARHGVISPAHAGTAGRDFPLRFQRNLLPETREMQDADRAGSAGTDHWNISVAHGVIFSLVEPRRPGTPGRGQFDVSLQTRHRGHNKFRSLVFPLPYSATSTHARAMETESAE